MADMSSDYQELSVTGKVYDLPLPSQLCVAVVFLWFCTTLCPVEPFVKCDQLARFAAEWAERIFTAESEGIWCDDSPVLCSMCSHIIQQLLLLDISLGPGLTHLQGLVKRTVRFCGN